MSGFRIVFIHGYTASSKADWYPRISPMLEKSGVDFVVPDLPGGTRPHAKDWLEAIHGEVSKSSKPLILVGHSLGTRTALLYLKKYRPKVEKVFLIAAFANDTANAIRRDGEAYPDFFEYKIDLDRIKALVGEFIVLHSRDDHSIDFEQGRAIAQDLDAKLITYEDRRHFSQLENGDEVFRVLKQELQF